MNSNPLTVRDSTTNLCLLSELLFNPGFFLGSGRNGALAKQLAHLSQQASDCDGDLEQLRQLAMTNHVIVRCFETLERILVNKGSSSEAEWVSNALSAEHARIRHALGFLTAICTALEEG